jgi:hypothetical protein
MQLRQAAGNVADLHKTDFADSKRVSLTVSSFEDDLKMKVGAALRKATLSELPALQARPGCRRLLRASSAAGRSPR